MDPLRSDDPRAIGQYRLLGRLGEGGMGQVYVARSPGGRTVAVKTIQPALAREPEFRTRFAREIATAQRVGGRWTAPVLDADTEAETPWVATGYIAGPTLYQVVAHDYGPLPESSVRFLAAGLVQALRDIHATGLVHRDLKPGNVMITVDGPRVIDFGIARALDAVTGAGLTRTGAVIGSPGFMSPEQVLGQRVTPAGDVFCLGSVLAYAATGRVPFASEGSSAHSVMFKIVEKEPDLQGVPEGLLPLITDCLRKDPEQRPTVEELLERTAEDAARSGAWLPADVLAQLGQQAIALLDSEGDQVDGADQRSAAAVPTVADAGAAAPHAVPTQAAAPSPVPGPSPAPSEPYPPTQLAREETRQAPGGQPPGPAAPPPPAGSGERGVARDEATARLRPRAPEPAAGAAREAKQLRGLAIALCLSLAALLLFGMSSMARGSELFIWLNGDSVSPGSEEWNDWSTATSIHNSIHNGMLMVTAVLWTLWFWRLRWNAGLLAPDSLQHSTVMAAASWYIPGPCFFLPRRIAEEVWRVLAPSSSPKQPVVTAWWWSWLVYLCSVAPLISCWLLWGDSDSLEDARALVMGSIVFQIPLLAAAPLAILFVYRATNLQRDRLAERQATPAEPAAAVPVR